MPESEQIISSMSVVGQDCPSGPFTLIFTWFVSYSVHFTASVTQAVMIFLSIPS